MERTEEPAAAVEQDKKAATNEKKMMWLTDVFGFRMHLPLLVPSRNQTPESISASRTSRIIDVATVSAMPNENVILVNSILLH